VWGGGSVDDDADYKDAAFNGDDDNYDGVLFFVQQKATCNEQYSLSTAPRQKIREKEKNGIGGATGTGP